MGGCVMKNLARALPSTDKSTAQSGRDVLMRERGPPALRRPRWRACEGITHGPAVGANENKLNRESTPTSRLGSTFREGEWLLPIYEG